MLIRGVVDDKLGDDAQPALVRRIEKCQEVSPRAVLRVDAFVVGDVVPVISQGRRVERLEPHRRDAERLDVIELLREAGEVTDAVAVAVGERANVNLIDGRVSVPEGIVRQCFRFRHSERLSVSAGWGLCIILVPAWRTRPSTSTITPRRLWIRASSRRCCRTSARSLATRRRRRTRGAGARRTPSRRRAAKSLRRLVRPRARSSSRAAPPNPTTWRFAG